MELSVSLYRYNPEQDKFPYMKNYKVKKPEKDIMVLDLLNMLKDCLLYTSPSPRD